MLRPLSFFAVFVLAGLALPARVEAAPITWEFSGFTVAQTPFCSSASLPCPSSTVYALTGSVEFDPATNQVVRISLDVDFPSLDFMGGAGSIQFGLPPLSPSVSGSAVRMTSALPTGGRLDLDLAPFAAGFTGPLTTPPSCAALPANELPFTSSCLVQVSDNTLGLRLVYGNINSIQAVPEPVSGLLVCTGLAMAIRRFRQPAERRKRRP